MNARQKDGATLRDHLTVVQRQTGTTPEQLVPVEFPDCMRYLWEWFCDISNGRDYSEHGPKALTYSEIESWANLTKTDPTAWEVSVLKILDRVYLTEAQKK